MIDEINETILVEQEEDKAPERDKDFGLYDENGEIIKEEENTKE